MRYLVAMPKTAEDEPAPERRVAFGLRLRRLRTEADLSQTAVASAAGLDRSYYAHVEAGRYSISIDKVFKIADALKVDPSHLFVDLSN